MGIYLRPFGKDLQSRTPGRLDEAWMGLVFLGSVAAFSIVFLGPWGVIKTAAYNVGSQDWWWYAFSFLALVLGLIPGALRLAVWAGQKASGARESLSKRFAATSHAILPLGFSAWIAFTIAFAFAKLSYILPVLADPFGWGWNLLGTGPLHVTAYFTEITPVIEILILVMGAGWSARNVLHHHRSSAVWRNGTSTAGTELGETGPTLMFILFYTVGTLWLLVG